MALKPVEVLIDFNEAKKQLISDFLIDTKKMLIVLEKYKNNDVQKRADEIYDAHQQGAWNLLWRKDLQEAWNAIGPSWKNVEVGKAIYASHSVLCSTDAFSKLGPSWSVALRTAARDALLLSSVIVAYGELEHPACQHACARWELWKQHSYVLGDHDNTLYSIPFVECS